MSWAFTVSRHCCNLSRQDLMILISWAKAEGAHQQNEPISRRNPSAPVLRHPGHSFSLRLSILTHSRNLPFPQSKHRQGPQPQCSHLCSSARDREGTGGGCGHSQGP